MLDAGRPSPHAPLPHTEDPDALVKRLRLQLPEIMAEARACRLVRRQEREDFELRYGPVRDESAREAEAAAVRREEEDERELAGRSPPPPDEEWEVLVEAVELVVPPSFWQRPYHRYRFLVLHRPSGRTWRVEKVRKRRGVG